MDLQDFLNRAKILRSIDRDELFEAGIFMAHTVWDIFRDDPLGWLMRRDDEAGDMVWTIVEKRAATPTTRNEPLPHPLDGKLEPEVKESTNERAPLYSLAISAKRIADALEGKDTYALNNMMENAGAAFALGMRGR